MFLEFWKRRQAEIAYEWDLLGYGDEEVGFYYHIIYHAVPHSILGGGTIHVLLHSLVGLQIRSDIPDM